jgi:hypothetical protein
MGRTVRREGRPTTPARSCPRPRCGRPGTGSPADTGVRRLRAGSCR